MRGLQHLALHDVSSATPPWLATVIYTDESDDPISNLICGQWAGLHGHATQDARRITCGACVRRMLRIGDAIQTMAVAGKLLERSAS